MSLFQWATTLPSPVAPVTVSVIAASRWALDGSPISLCDILVMNSRICCFTEFSAVSKFRRGYCTQLAVNVFEAVSNFCVLRKNIRDVQRTD